MGGQYQEIGHYHKPDRRDDEETILPIITSTDRFIMILFVVIR